MSNSALRTVLVGAGNVARGLEPALRASCDLVAVANRTPQKIVGAVGLSEVAAFEPDVIIVAVADSAVDAVAVSIGRIDSNPLCLLTSGTVSMNRLKGISNRVGVIYPLQTFTEGFPVNIAEVPFFTETSQPQDLAIVDRLVHRMGAQAYHADEEERKSLHIAGVLTNNFVNVLLEQTQKVLETKGYTLDVVKPLIEMTVRKAFALGPHAAQTGPARRGDTEVMRSQYEQIPDDLKDAFEQLNRLICKSHNTTYYK